MTARAPKDRVVAWFSAAYALATLLLARAQITAILAKGNGPTGALDDTYIHMQYARAFAEGHPLRYFEGAPVSTGATSILWPLVLAPFHAAGADGARILWPAWLLSYAALFGLAREIEALTRPLCGLTIAFGAGALALAFGGFAWGAGSGMEAVPFAYLIALTVRLGAEWSERAPSLRTGRAMLPLLAASFALAFCRPEGALFVVAVAIVVCAYPPLGRRHYRLSALAPLVIAAAPSLVLLALTGSTTSSTAQAKLLALNPYYSVWSGSLANARLLVDTILQGEAWGAEYLPPGLGRVALAAVASIPVVAASRGRIARGMLVLLVAAALAVPCTYSTFLWNRLRYLWPFATGWIIGCACLAWLVGEIGARVSSRLRVLGPATIFTAVGLFAARIDGVIHDVAQSASGIGRQHVAIARWVAENLPTGALVGVNDTGAIAYFGRHPTFDVVGLTTPGEARYWVAGSASRFEHYERMRAEGARLPDFFAVYPEWMSCEPLLGEALFERTVTDATILGGHTMRVYRARYDTLGTGEAPWSSGGRIIDRLDVADLESEAAHGYALFDARETDQVVEEAPSPAGVVVADGGRGRRARDWLEADLPPGSQLRAVARLRADYGARLVARVDGSPVAELDVPDGEWTEVSFPVRVKSEGGATTVDLEARGTARFASFHYFFVDEGGGPDAR